MGGLGFSPQDGTLWFMQALGGFAYIPVLVGLTFLFLRYSTLSGIPTLQQLKNHSFAVGFFGWLASSLVGAQEALRIDDPQNLSPRPYYSVFVPLVLVLLLHAAGQLSYPGNRGRRRVAQLGQRRMLDFLPIRLGITTAVIAVGSLVVVLLLVGAPGFPALPPPPTDSGYSVARPGRVDGTMAALVLGSAWGVLAMGTLAVLALITHRKDLNGVDAFDNEALRTLAMNRLLRTVATMFSGLAWLASVYMFIPAPGVRETNYTNWVAIVNMVVLLVMWGWPTPALSLSVKDVKVTEHALLWHNASIRGTLLGCVAVMIAAVWLSGLNLATYMAMALVIGAAVVNLWNLLWAVPAARAASRKGRSAFSDNPDSAGSVSQKPASRILRPSGIALGIGAIALPLGGLITLAILQQFNPRYVRLPESPDFDGSYSPVADIFPAGQQSVGYLILVSVVLLLALCAGLAIKAAVMALPLPYALGPKDRLIRARWGLLCTANGAALFGVVACLASVLIQPVEIQTTSTGGFNPVTSTNYGSVVMIACIAASVVLLIRSAQTLNVRRPATIRTATLGLA